MKKTTCNDLKGACDVEITGSTPEEMGTNSKKHIMEMIQSGDQSHIDAVESMKNLNPEEQKSWYDDFVKRFDDLPDV